MDERVADSAGLGSFVGVAAASGPPPAAVRDTAKFLDVDVDQLAGMVSVDAPDDPTGWPVHECQPVHSMPSQDPIDRRCWQTNDRSKSGRAPFEGLTELNDLGLDFGCGSVWARQRPARPINQPADPFRSEPPPPLVSRWTRHTHLGRNMSNRPTSLDSSDHREPPQRRQPSITVSHEFPLAFVKT